MKKIVARIIYYPAVCIFVVLVLGGCLFVIFAFAMEAYDWVKNYRNWRELGRLAFWLFTASATAGGGIWLFNWAERNK